MGPFQGIANSALFLLTRALEIDMMKSIKITSAKLLYASVFLTSFTAAIADTVVVGPGDTLALIAERELGNRNRYKEICELNLRALRHDCNYLTIGMVLNLPPRGEARKVTASSAPGIDSSTPNTIILIGDYMATFGRFGKDSLNVPEGYEARLADDHVELSGYVADASPGGRPGVWLQLPELVEKRASGKMVLVKVVVRMRRTPGPIALAYSTADVGNSGWIAKGVGTEFEVVSFAYEVPEMRKGRGDFIGILPDPKNVGQVLHVAEIAVIFPEN